MESLSHDFEYSMSLEQLQYDKLVLLNEKQAINRRLNIIDKKINAKLPTIKGINERKRKAN